MTRGEIETLLHDLAATQRHLQHCASLVRQAAEHLAEASDDLRTIADRVEAAIVLSLTHLHQTDQKP